MLLLPGLIQFWRPWLLFQVPEFFDSSFLQVKVSSGLHRSPDGPQGCWTTEATPAFVQRTVLGTVPKRSLVHSGVKSADSQTLEGDVISYLLLRKSSVRGLRQIGGVSQTGYVYPELLLKNVKKFLVLQITHLQKSKPLKSNMQTTASLHKKKTFKIHISLSCRHWQLFFIHWLKLSTFLWKAWGHYFIAFVSNFRGRGRFLCFIIFKGAERTAKVSYWFF